ncbi:hypothetical protein MPTK1_2g18790 [Marchantia polymorpha subsp. ruderalis]|uniref:Uncharacterized protein n=1 Tax=Marchantia polymorpha TaxID=3197 RepID=A0A2R6W700_MARPO|nr:hypothetical protein MARPO_0137s0004 [Marchantia polymorpha]BBN02868.1 hypothetical protein Mp_2g18790 [Marchantia polymorpha subsp. ruderalis]|eukprot:PTQ29629.1 hypothetical protein MARPO_0137s0004 [Marchantia polymorpha]
MAKLTTENMQGIPQPYTPFKLMNADLKKFLAVKSEYPEAPIVEDTDINTLEVYWYLVSSEKREASYNIINMKTGLALTAKNSTSVKTEVYMQTLEEFDENQLWVFIPASFFSFGFYRVQNYSARVELTTKAVENGNSVTTFVLGDGPEIFELQWRFKFSVGDRQGIPPPSTPFRLMNYEHQRFVFGEDKVVFLRDALNNLLEQQFRLVAPPFLSKLRQTYMIQNLQTKGFVTDDGAADGKLKTLQLAEKDVEDERQYWIIVPSKEFAGGFRLRNVKTQGYLLNGPTHLGNQLSTLGSIKEWPDQVWIFSLVLPALE